jgi:transposase InsO family protein
MLDHWAYWHHVALEFSRPGKPVDNTFIEAFNGTLRRECLSLHALVPERGGPAADARDVAARLQPAQ